MSAFPLEVRLTESTALEELQLWTVYEHVAPAPLLDTNQQKDNEQPVQRKRKSSSSRDPLKTQGNPQGLADTEVDHEAEGCCAPCARFALELESTYAGISFSYGSADVPDKHAVHF